jgi:coenzyme F420-dependent glucose-6-phosphate dehydrogenase
MLQIGYALSSEEHAPNQLVSCARMAEEAGFTFALISDHYHPWIDQQGQSPFVWSVIGGIAHATTTLHVGTGVTCPTMRIHPAIIAQAAATAAAMMPGRFFLGVGTGENLNEHILGDPWPRYVIRQRMLEEAVEIIHLLWQGGIRSYQGLYYTVANAQVYTLPDEPPPIIFAASGPRSAKMAGRIGDGIIGISPDAELLKAFEATGGSGKPRYGQATVCWAESEEEARHLAYQWWPNTGLKGGVNWELPLPAHFEEMAQLVSEDKVAESIVCGPDPEQHIKLIKRFADAGYDHVYVHQVGPNQEGFFRFYEREVLPKFQQV